MPPLSNHTLFSVTILLTLLPLYVSAQGSTGARRNETGQCPPNAEELLAYSPFKPYFTWMPGNIQHCWVIADCLFETAGESRKQQFGATALVMGLIPLTLKDIAWPERRLIHVTEPLNWFVEVLVLGLGLVPVETDDEKDTVEKSQENNMIAKRAWGLNRGSIIMVIVACWLGVFASYAGLAFMEIYSKRSALGCPFPIFVSAWYVVALIPASIHAIFARLRRKREARRANEAKRINTTEQPVHRRKPSKPENDQENKIISAVQGADEDWPVQMAWGVYYIAGTLIFTSIMAVTVVELVCWVGLGVAVTGSSKVLAFFMCLVNEKTGDKRRVATMPL